MDVEIWLVLVIGRDLIGKVNCFYFGDFNVSVYVVDFEDKWLLWKKKIDDYFVVIIIGMFSLFEDWLYIFVFLMEVVFVVNE